MNELIYTALSNLVSDRLNELGITPNLESDNAAAEAFQKCTEILEGYLKGIKQQNSEAREQLSKTEKATTAIENMLDACRDRSGAQALPQQDMNAEPEPPAPQPEQPVPPAPDAGMMPPVDQGMPAPGPDMGAMPPAPDAGMMMPPPDAGAVPPAPDMMQVDPSMLGALQPRF